MDSIAPSAQHQASEQSGLSVPIRREVASQQPSLKLPWVSGVLESARAATDCGCLAPHFPLELAGELVPPTEFAIAPE